MPYEKISYVPISKMIIIEESIIIPTADELIENYYGINVYFNGQSQGFYFLYTSNGIEVKSEMYVNRQEAIDAINKLIGIDEPPVTGIRMNPLPWTGWYEWHSSAVARSTFPKGGYSTLEASDYVATGLKLAITKQDLHLKLKGLNLTIRFTVAVESVDDANFLRCAIVPRIDPATGIDNSKALYTEYTFYTGRKTNSQSGGNYKERKIANMPVDQVFQTFEFPLSQHLIEDWGQKVYDSYMLAYIAPTIEMRKGAAKILISDVAIYG